MLELTTGNPLDATTEALVSTVNTVGVMDIALQFRLAFPRNFEIYRSACKRGDVVPGKMFVVPADRLDNPKLRVIRQENIRSVAIPPLGCGDGGLDWNDVRPRILEALAALPDVEVSLYESSGAPQVEDMALATKKPAMNPISCGWRGNRWSSNSSSGNMDRMPRTSIIGCGGWKAISFAVNAVRAYLTVIDRNPATVVEAPRRS